MKIKRILANIFKNNNINLSDNILLFIMDVIHDYLPDTNDLTINKNDIHYQILIGNENQILLNFQDRNINMAIYRFDNNKIMITYNSGLLEIISPIINNKCFIYHINEEFSEIDLCNTISEKMTLVTINGKFDEEIKMEDKLKTRYFSKVLYKSNKMENYYDLKCKASLMQTTNLKTAIFYTDDENNLFIVK